MGAAGNFGTESRARIRQQVKPCLLRCCYLLYNDERLGDARLLRADWNLFPMHLLLEHAGVSHSSHAHVLSFCLKTLQDLDRELLAAAVAEQQSMLGVPHYGTGFLYRVSLVQNQLGLLFVQHLPSTQKLCLSMRYGQSRLFKISPRRKARSASCSGGVSRGPGN